MIWSKTTNASCVAIFDYEDIYFALFIFSSFGQA